jgi:glycine dehydrogenase subunit 1
VAELCYHKAHYLAAQIDALPGYELASTGPFFNEFVIRCPRPVSEINARLLAARVGTASDGRAPIVGGLDLSRFYPGKEHEMLLCATEVHSRAMLDQLVRALEAAT